MGQGNGEAPDLHWCPDGGVLVSGKGHVPEDPSESAPRRIRFGGGIGCNRLKCGACGAWVRQQPRLSTDRWGAKAARALYTREDWTGAPGVERSRYRRLYACECTVWPERYLRHIHDPDPDPSDPAPPPWTCQGHPTPTLPLDVDGVSIDETTDFGALVRRVFSGWLPDGLPYIQFYEIWVSRLYERLTGLPAAEALARAVGGCVDDPDPLQVGSALVFFGRYPEAPGFDRVVALAGDAGRPETVWPALLQDGDRFHCRLTDVLTSRLRAAPQPLSGLDASARDAFRQLLLDPGATVDEASVEAMSAWDAEWAANHAVEMVRAHPDVWRALLEGLSAEDDSWAVIAGVALAGSKVVAAAEMREWLDDQGSLTWVEAVRRAL